MIENGIYEGDCIDYCNWVANNYGEVFDLIVTSPPYNVDLGNNKYKTEGYNSYDDNKDHDEYLDWLEAVFAEVGRAVKSGGRICINIGDGKNGRVPTHVHVSQMMEDLGYLPFTTLIWNKKQIGNRTAWGSWKSASCPSFPTPFEYILVFAKESLKLQTEGESDIEKQEFIDWSLAMWEFGCESNPDHPAQFPIELPKRLIKMLSYTNARVYDPFAGAGTTLVAAKQLGRDYAGSEIDPEYCDTCLERLSNV